MLKTLSLTVISCLLLTIAQSQGVAINSDGSAPDTSAMLDVKSSNKGVLIPRLALTGIHDSATIHFPKTSLLVYNTATAGGLNPGFYYWNVDTWTTFGGFSYVLQQNLNTNGKYISGDGGNNGLFLDTNGIVLGRGSFGAGNPLPTQDSGSSLIWYPKKAAFRVGYNTGGWQDPNIGPYSVVMGYEGTASGYAAMALGQSSTADAGGAVAIGTICYASGNNAVAIGSNSQAYADGSVALGNSAYIHSTGVNGLALGYGTYVSGPNGIAMGNLSQALGNTSTAMGYTNYANGNYSVVMGSNSTSAGAYSVVAGDSVNVFGQHSFGLGSHIETGGSYNFAFGNNINSNGVNSGAFGNTITANGPSSFGMGNHIYTTGIYSFGMGNSLFCAGAKSFAVGNNLTTNGASSVALGSYATTSHDGSFILADASTTTSTTSSSTNQMTMRFDNGYRLFTNSATTVGVMLAGGGNAWSTISDVFKKENFEPVDGEAFLQKISAMPLTSWNYKGQQPGNNRHYGPMAQDFYAAFGKDKVGTIGNDTTINQADFDGINFIGVQALEKRTADLKVANTQLKEENARLEADVKKLQDQLDNLTNLVMTISAKH